jgi:hypothetical protein
MVFTIKMGEITSAEEFYQLRTSDLEPEYSRAAEEPASIAVWKDVVARFPEMREWVAYNKTAPIEILEVLSRDRDERVRGMVATRRKLDRSLFERLATDRSPWVRRSIATNGKAPFDVRASLIWDKDPDVLREAHRALSVCKPTHEELEHPRELEENDRSFFGWLDREIEMALAATEYRSFEDPFGYLCGKEGPLPVLVGPLFSQSLKDLWLYAVDYFHEYSQGIPFADGTPGTFRGMIWTEARTELERQRESVRTVLGTPY